jgi:hypothetical protein
MAPILLSQLRSTISSSLISIFCKKFEENEIALRKSIDASICTVLIGLDSIIKTNVLYDKIIDSISNSNFYKTIEFENGKLSSINYSFEEEGFIPLNLIFSIKRSRISEMISNEIGVKSETAKALLNFAVMLTLSHLKNEKQKVKFLQSTLDSEKSNIIKALPTGIRVILGYSNFVCEDYNETDSFPSIKSNFINQFLDKVFK